MFWKNIVDLYTGHQNTFDGKRLPTNQITRFHNLGDNSFEDFYAWVHSLKI